MAGDEQAWRRKKDSTNIVSDPNRTFGLAIAAVASLLALMLFHWAPPIAFASSFVGFAITHAHGYH